MQDGKNLTTSILARKNRILQLEEEVGVGQVSVDEASRRKGQLHSEIQSLESGSQDAQSELKARGCDRDQRGRAAARSEFCPSGARSED